jgi:DNA-binding MarR family transcriptional regulator
MIRPKDRKLLEDAKRESVGQLLLKSARLMDEVAVGRVNREAGAPFLRPAHTKLFPHIDLDGTRVGTIAERLGVSKQAVSLLVAELAELGMLELCPDPDDGRAKKVRFTRKGLEGIHHGLGVLRAIEEDLTARIGARPMAALRAALSALTPALEELARAEGGAEPPAR